MVLSSAGRRYTLETVLGEDGAPTVFWICEDCGAVVGALRRLRDAHDTFHSRIARSM